MRQDFVAQAEALGSRQSNPTLPQEGRHYFRIVVDIVPGNTYSALSSSVYGLLRKTQNLKASCQSLSLRSDRQMTIRPERGFSNL